MSKYLNREEVYDAYLSSDTSAWSRFVGGFATEGCEVNSKLYYLSFDSTLSGPHTITTSFEDNQTSVGDCYYKELFTVTLPERLLTSTSLQGAWNQLHTKFQHLFGFSSDIETPIDVYLYEVDIRDCLYIDDRELTLNWLVHNAYTNGTHAVFGQPTLSLVKHLKVQNTLHYPDEYLTYYTPYNDSRYKPLLLSTPLVIIESKDI